MPQPNPTSVATFTHAGSLKLYGTVAMTQAVFFYNNNNKSSFEDWFHLDDVSLELSSSVRFRRPVSKHPLLNFRECY